MEIPLLDLKRQYQSIKKDIDETVKRVVESQYFILSSEVTDLEKEVADYCGVKYAAGVASGTDAIILSLKACGISRGDYVLTTPFTFFATSESISIIGAIPIFVDIDKDTYNIDPKKIVEVIGSMDEEKRKKLKAIIPVHLYGQCADMDEIMSVAKKHDLKVIEDSAQAIGATYKGKKACSFGDTGSLSFFPSKNLGAFGDGGMVVSNNEEIINEVKKLRVHGSIKQYVHSEVAYNSRLDSLQAAVLRVKLKSLDKWLEGRREIASKYNEAFSGIDEIKTPITLNDNKHTFHQYTMYVDSRDELMKYLNDKGVSARVYYPIPLHLQPCYEDMKLNAEDFPVSNDASLHVLSIPVYPELSAEEVGYIIDTVKEFYKK